MKKKIMTLSFILVLSLIVVGCSVGGEKGDNNKPEDVEVVDEKGQRIVVISREDGSGTRGAFVELTGVLDKDSEGNKIDKTTEEAIIQMKTDAVLSSIAGDEAAVGYLSLGSLNDKVKGLEIDGFAPTSENVKSGDYKVVRPFNIATKGERSEIAQDFINFILSSEGQEVVAENYIAVDELAPFEGKLASGKLVIAGSSSVTPVMELLKEAYVEINPNAEIEIQLSDSSAGMQAVIDGIVDIGMASRELKETELSELQAEVIALDGIAVITNLNNDVVGLTMDQLKEIYTGEITNWNEVK